VIPPRRYGACGAAGRKGVALLLAVVVAGLAAAVTITCLALAERAIASADELRIAVAADAAAITLETRVRSRVWAPGDSLSRLEGYSRVAWIGGAAVLEDMQLEGQVTIAGWVGAGAVRRRRWLLGIPDSTGLLGGAGTGRDLIPIIP